MDTKPAQLEFDYRLACQELILPEVHKLHPDALAIYRELRDAPEYDKLRQGSDLDVPIPAALQDRLGDLPTDALAIAARMLYYLGHWSGELDAGKPDARGATWKFSNMADQVLCKRLGLPTRNANYPNGWSFAVHEGALRLGASTRDSWTWIELGPATQYFLHRAQDWVATLPPYIPMGREWEGQAWAATREIPAQLLALLDPQWTRLVTAHPDYMRPKGKLLGDCPECGKSPLFKSAAANHEMTCSRFPMEARADALLRHASVYGITKEQEQAIRELLLKTRPSGEPMPRTAHDNLPGENC